MELTKTEPQELQPADNSNLPLPMQNMLTLPVIRQLGLMIGLAASVAIGVAIVLWSQATDYSVMYSNLTGQTAQHMAEVLDQYDIKYRLDPDSGVLMVESGKINDAKLKLAAADLANPQSSGFEMIEKDQGFGSSAFIQSARYQHAQEIELARTITSIGSVQSARVHLAIPKESAFVRNRRKPSASVMIKLVPGRKLEKGQVQAIINLVSASIPNMESSEVTLVDDKGRLLSSDNDDTDMALTTSQLDYTRKVERTYTQRIEDILSPLVGLNGVRAQVNADIDFTRSESTSEVFNPDLPAIRSEQLVEEETKGSIMEGGVPGALSNQPPAAGTAPEQATAEDGTPTPVQPSKKRNRSTRNYELDKTISHTRRVPGSIRRLSIAVLLDVRTTTDEEGTVIPQPYSTEELNRFTSLVKEAVGFNTLRGDSVNVINAAFVAPVEFEVPEQPLWEKNWFLTLMKQILGGLLVLLLFFGVLKPVMKNLSRVHVVSESTDEEEEDELAEDQLTIGADGQPARLPRPNSYEGNLTMARQMASQEPKRVALVVKNWIEEGK